jgi:hypothetical protein
LFSTHPCTSSLILVVEGGRKEGKTKASFERNIRGLLRDAKGRDGPPTVMEVCARCVFARAVEECQSRQLRKHRRHQPRKGGLTHSGQVIILLFYSSQLVRPRSRSTRTEESISTHRRAKSPLAGFSKRIVRVFGTVFGSDVTTLCLRVSRKGRKVSCF